MISVSPYALGATLYLPATRPDLLAVAVGGKIPHLRSLVVCLEDSVNDRDLAHALENVTHLLEQLDAMGGRTTDNPLLFLRPRHNVMARSLLEMAGIRHIDGIVAPKLNLNSIDAWAEIVLESDMWVMPTLETREVFDPVAMCELRDAIQSRLAGHVLALRIGGNDLLNCLGIRRSRSHTAYSTPLGYAISMLCGVMGAAGFALTAPVFEWFDTDDVLRQELELDVMHGLVGKTAIHPNQIQIIEAAFKVRSVDLELAQRMLSEDSNGVFSHDGAMCEPATHHGWARSVIERAHWYGVDYGQAAHNNVQHLVQQGA